MLLLIDNVSQMYKHDTNRLQFKSFLDKII